MKRLFAVIFVLVLCACLCGCESEKYAVHVKAPESWDSVHLWAWDVGKDKDAFKEWPGTLMTAEGEGWYSAEVPEWVDSVIVSGNGGSVQTEDIQYISREVWITVYEDLSNWRQYDEKPQYTTATVAVPADWGTPYCWAWSEADKKDVFAARPGQAMIQDGDYYTIELPAWVDSIVISNSDGTVRTANLAVEPGKDFWVSIWETGNTYVVYSEAEMDTALKYSAEALYAALNTVDQDQISGDKSLTCVFYVKSGEEQSRQPVLDLLPGEEAPTAPEEIRYLVNYKYTARRASNYIGALRVYYTSIQVEVVDLLTGDVIAEETFEGEDLPDEVSAKGFEYYAPYPDDALVQQWVVDVLKQVR